LKLEPAELLRAAEDEPAGTDAVDWLRTAHEWLVLDSPQVTHRRAGRRIGEELIRELDVRVAELRHLDDHLAGDETYQLVSRELASVSGLVDDAAYTERVGLHLLAIVGELGQLAGWVASDAGMSEVAREHYVTGARAARDGQRADIVANCLSSLSYQMATIDGSRDAVLLASTAVKGTDAAHPAVRTLMLDRLAWAHARVGDAAAAGRALDRATELLAGSVDPPPAWLYWLDEAEAEIMAGRCWAELHRPLRAVPLLEQTVRRVPSESFRELALYLSWLAVAYTDAAEPERAAEVGTRILELTASTSSARVDRRLAYVLARLEEYGNVPAVAAFRANAGRR
jgi:tetratricopeptide (TPR) repeat protein